MSEILDFLNRCLDEDERTAEACESPAPWTVRYRGESTVTDADDHAVIYDEGAPGACDAVHIAAWDPGRVLAEVAAKRRILDRHPGANAEDECPGCGAHLDGTWRTGAGELCPEQVDMAQPFAGRPGWREEWTLQLAQATADH